MKKDGMNPQRQRLMVRSLMGVLVGICLMASCGKEKEVPSPLPVMPTLEHLTDTEWEGSYNSPIEYQGTPITMKLVWTIDFLTDSTGSVLVEVSSPFSQTEYNDFVFYYSYDGVSKGYLYDGDEVDTFAVSAVNKTITMNLQMPVGLGEGANEQTILGGETVLYRIR